MSDHGRVRRSPDDRWWSDVWVRIGLLYPLVFVVPAVVIAQLLGSRSARGDILWALGLVVAGAAASFVASAVTVLRSQPPGARSLPLTVAVAISCFGVIVGSLVWYHAATVACDGLSECPF